MIYPPIDLRHTCVWTLFPPFRSLKSADPWLKGHYPLLGYYGRLCRLRAFSVLSRFKGAASPILPSWKSVAGFPGSVARLCKLADT